MKTILWLLLLIPSLLAAQPNYEIREYTGVVKAIEPTWALAYEGIRIEIDGKLEHYRFHTKYGKWVLENVKVNDRITIRVNVNLKARASKEERIKKFESKLKASEADILEYFSQEYITEIQVNGAWLPLTGVAQPLSRPNIRKVFLEKKVVNLYKRDGNTKAIVFENGIIGSYSLPGLNSINDIQIGDVVSFMGQMRTMTDGEVYPVTPVKEIYFFGRLFKNTGHIKSFLFKQNDVCIGVTMETANSEVQVSFPSDFATRVNDLLISGREVTFYYFDDKDKKITKPNLLDPTELHAIIAGKDTLKIEKSFYGGADGFHEHRPATVSGKITRINRSDAGKMMSVIVGTDAYVEITLATAQQIESFLKKGKEMEVTGDERVKKEGEMYRRNYRLITPKTIKLDGKEFLLK